MAVSLTLRIHRTRPRGCLLNHKEHGHQVRPFCPALALVNVTSKNTIISLEGCNLTTFCWPAVPTAE